MRDSFLHAAFVIGVGVVGCDHPPTPISPNPVEEPSPREPPSDATDASVEPESADAGAADASEAAPPAAVPNLLGIDPAIAAALEKESVLSGRKPVDYDTFRKLDPDGKYAACAPARFGAADGYLCELSVPESEKTGHSVLYIAALVLKGGKLAELQRFPTQARALDFPEAIYATLKAEYDDQTGVLTLTDGVFPCDRAVDSEDTSLEFQRVVNRLCTARGTHQFKGKTFQHKDKLPPLAWKGPKRKSAFSGP